MRSRIVVWRLAKLPQRHNTNTRRLFWVASQRVQALCVFGGSPAPSLLYVMSMRVFNTGASPCRFPYNTFTRSLYLRRVACPRSRHDVLVHCCFGGSPIACLAYHVRALLFIRAARQPMFFIRTTPAPWSSILVWLLGVAQLDCEFIGCKNVTHRHTDTHTHTIPGHAKSCHALTMLHAFITRPRQERQRILFQNRRTTSRLSSYHAVIE